jgi:hypothetical protein
MEIIRGQPDVIPTQLFKEIVMKTKITLAATLVAAVALFSNGAFAAADSDKVTAPEATATKTKPHSHMEEKTGVTAPAKDQKEATPAEGQKKVAKKQHFHPRDGK